MAAHVVTAAAVVLPTIDGSERYLYRGAPVGDGFPEAGIEHALSLGLIGVDTVREELEAALAAEVERVAAEKAATEKAEADRVAAEKRAADEKKAADKKAADAKAAAAAKP
jgi:hypothetical protein